MSKDIQAIRFIRRMRGSSQAALLEASDGAEYVVKAPNNPNGRRTLINEWLGSRILHKLDIKTPQVKPIQVSDTFLQSSPDMYFATSGEGRPVQAGIHLASEHVGHCASPVYDFLPTVLLQKIRNSADFIGALIADKFMGNTDARQCVFARAREMPTNGRLAYMIDHGQFLDGSHWQLTDAPLFGVYLDRSIYAGVESWASFEPWIERLDNLDAAFFETVISTIPSEWINDDRPSLDRMTELLIPRRRDVPRFIEELRDSSVNPFIKWTKTSVYLSGVSPHTFAASINPATDLVSVGPEWLQ